MTTATPSAPSSGRIWRQLGWVGFVVIVVAGEVVTLIPASASTRQLLGDLVVYLLPLFLAFVAAVTTTIRIRGNDRQVMGLVAAASGMLLISQIYVTWYLYAVNWRGPELPAFFELFQLGAVIAFLWIIATMSAYGEMPLVTRMRTLVDVGMAMTVATAVVYWWIMLPLFGDVPGAGWHAAAVTSFYPVVGATLLISAVSMFVGWRSYSWRACERLLVGALCFYGVGLIFEPFWYAQLLRTPHPAETDILNYLFGMGFYLLFMAIVYRATVATSTLDERLPIPRVRPRWLPAAYPMILALALPLMALASLQVSPAPEGEFVLVLTIVLAVALIARSWLSNIERLHLTGLATTDMVSGAFNHRYLYSRLAEEFTEADASAVEPAIAIFDIDDFHRVNTIWGHDRGDSVLRQVADLITANVGPHATVCRTGSDEFAVIMTDMLPADVVAFARRAQRAVASALVLPSETVSLSVGIAFYPRHGSTAEQVLAHAVAAQQLARAAEIQVPVVYDDEAVGSVDPVERLARVRGRSHRAIVRSLAAAVDARDPDTRHHSENVGELATSLAAVLGLPAERIRVIGLAAQMHDVGKIALRDEVLLKPGTLTPEERHQVEEHPVLGERILAPAQLDEVLPTVRHHHEWWDGTGYPDGLMGPQIPLEARVLSVCDAFEAMTAPRSWRPARSLRDALEEIESRSGTQFDPDVAATFVRMIMGLQGPVASYEDQGIAQQSPV